MENWNFIFSPQVFLLVELSAEIDYSIVFSIYLAPTLALKTARVK
jgi:hypothetical protein